MGHPFFSFALLVCVVLVSACSSGGGPDAGPRTDGGPPDLPTTFDAGRDSDVDDLGTSGDLGTDLSFSDLDADTSAPDAGPPVTDPIELACRVYADGSRTCTSACAEAVDDAQTVACASQISVMTSDPEMPAYRGCTDLCPVARTCPGPGGILDCTCTTMCARVRSDRFQRAVTNVTNCFSSAVAPACT